MKKLILIALLSYLPAHAMDEEMKEVVIRGNITRVRELLAQGIDSRELCNAERGEATHLGWTFLHFAARSGHDEIVRELLDRGADVNARNNNGWTPLHLAAANNEYQIAAVLLDHGADTNIKGSDRRTAYDLDPIWMSQLMDDFRARKRSKIKGIPTAEGAQ